MDKGYQLVQHWYTCFKNCSVMITADKFSNLVLHLIFSKNSSSKSRIHLSNDQRHSSYFLSSVLKTKSYRSGNNTETNRNSNEKKFMSKCCRDEIRMLCLTRWIDDNFFGVFKWFIMGMFHKNHSRITTIVIVLK